MEQLSIEEKSIVKGVFDFAYNNMDGTGGSCIGRRDLNQQEIDKVLEKAAKILGFEF